MVGALTTASGMGATAVNVFGGLVNQGLPCKTWFIVRNVRLLTVVTALFSMFLTPNAVGEAELTFGGIDSTKFQGESKVLAFDIEDPTHECHQAL